MKKSIGCIALLLAAVGSLVAWQALPAVWIYGWNGGPVWLRLGPTLALTNGQIDVVLPPATTRRYDVQLAFDATAGGWKLPANASALTIYVNGVRYGPSNYTVAGGVLKAKFTNMDSAQEVAADYDELRP